MKLFWKRIEFIFAVTGLVILLIALIYNATFDNWNNVARILILVNLGFWIAYVDMWGLLRWKAKKLFKYRDVD